MSNKKTNSSKSKTSKKAKASKPALESLQQTNGKNYEQQVARARELENILGTKKINPFKTNDKKVFGDMIKDMNLTDLQALAVKVGVFPAGNKTVLKNKLKKAFDQSLYGTGSVQIVNKPKDLDPKNKKDRIVLDYLNN